MVPRVRASLMLMFRVPTFGGLDPASEVSPVSVSISLLVLLASPVFDVVVGSTAASAALRFLRFEHIYLRNPKIFCLFTGDLHPWRSVGL